MPRVPRAASAGIGRLCLDPKEGFWGHDMMSLGTISSSPSFGLKRNQSPWRGAPCPRSCSIKVAPWTRYWCLPPLYMFFSSYKTLIPIEHPGGYRNTGCSPEPTVIYGTLARLAESRDGKKRNSK